MMFICFVRLFLRWSVSSSLPQNFGIRLLDWLWLGLGLGLGLGLVPDFWDKTNEIRGIGKGQL